MTENPSIRDFSWTGAGKTFTSFHRGLYKPLVMLSYATEYHFFNLDPVVYHTTNIVLHVLNTLSVFWLIYLISRQNFLVAFLTAILFGIHPLRVESVAWITERKDLLYSLFYVWGLISYLYFLRKEKNIFSLLTLAFFLLSLLSKPMALTLPLLLLLLDVWERRPLSRKLWIEKTPLFILATGFLAMNILMSIEAGKIHTTSTVRAIQTAAYVPLFYIYKIFIPFRLSCAYPNPEFMDTWARHFYDVSPLFFILLLGLLFKRARHISYVIFGALFFIISLLPVLQIAPFGVSIVADRYTYLASIGIFYIFSEVFCRWADKAGIFPRRAAYLGFVALALLLSILTWNQCGIWKDNFSLWSNAIKNYPKVAIAYFNRGADLCQQERYDEALQDLSKVEALGEADADTYFLLGNIYYRKGNNGQAIFSYQRAIGLKPDHLDAHYNLAQAFFNVGFRKQGALCLKQCLQIDPGCEKAKISLQKETPANPKKAHP